LKTIEAVPLDKVSFGTILTLDDSL